MGQSFWAQEGYLALALALARPILGTRTNEKLPDGFPGIAKQKEMPGGSGGLKGGGSGEGPGGVFGLFFLGFRALFATVPPLGGVP